MTPLEYSFGVMRITVPQLLSRADAAVALGISKEGLDRLLRRGDLPIVRVGVRGVRVPAAALARYVAERTTPVNEA